MDKLLITLFGEFTISYKDKIFTERDCKGSKSLKLLEYLISYRDRYTTQAKLIDILWQDSDNPANALKTLVHRTRNMLSEFFGEDIDFIVSEHGTYSFNKALPHIIDADEFNSLTEIADNEDLQPLKRAQIYRRAMLIYKGDYLSSNAEESWVQPLNVFYDSMYTSLAEKCAKLLYPLGRFTDIVKICEQAVQVSPHNENIHADLIRALVALGEYDLAEKQYRYAKQLFMDNLGLALSPRLTELYELTVKSRSETGRSLPIVLGELREGGVPEGGFYCEYEIFRYIYRLYVRDCQRKDVTMSVIFLSLQAPNGTELKIRKIVTSSMQKLSEAISGSIRKRDVYTRYSLSQYLVALPAADEAAAKTVGRRITGKFEKFAGKNKLKLKIEVRDVFKSENYKSFS